MTLPANSTAITFQNINTELGAVGNVTTSYTNMVRTMNDTAIRNFTPGTGHTINATSGGQISMFDLNTAYLRELYMGYTVAFGTVPLFQSSTVDSYGNKIFLFGYGLSATQIYVLKYDPHLKTLLWARNITFNNANGTSFANIGAYNGTIDVDANDNIYVSFIYTYVAKYTFEQPAVVSFDTNGTYRWQTGNIYGSTTTNLVPTYTHKIACVNSTRIMLCGMEGGSSTFLNSINASSGAVVANNTYGITNYVSNAICIVSGRNDQGNSYIGGYATNTSQYGVFSQYTTSDTIAWSRRVDTSNTYVADIVVDTSGSPFCLVPYGFNQSTSSNTTVNLMKFNSSGTFQWSRQIAYPTAGSNWSMDIDVNGNIYIGNAFAANSTANGGIQLSAFNSTGTALWHNYVTSSSTANVTNFLGRVSVSGNRVMIQPYQSNSTNYLTDTIQLNANTGSTAGTYTAWKITSLSPTVTSNATGFITATTVTGTLTGAATVASANITTSTNSTTQAFTTVNIT